MTVEQINALNKVARQLRRDVLEMIHIAGSGHPGGSLSCADFTAALYFSHLRHDPKNPDWPDRDRVIYSKGHVAPILYAALARSGYFPVEQLKTLRRLDSPLQGHPAIDLPGVEVGTGSLGQGLSVGVGMAMAGLARGADYQVYVVLGDGELQEGQVWEAVMAGAHYCCHNLCAFVDYNNLQIDGCVADVMNIADLAAKWKAFNWNVIECDGHDMASLTAALDLAKRNMQRPTVIIGKTVKGKGVSFMEDQAGWHGKAPNADELAKALAELSDGEDAQ